MQIEERYRAALVALRDGQWEVAATHLLTIAAEDPAYREIDRVLEVLERTRSISYWCAAFEIARSQGAIEQAHAALNHVATLAPDLARLQDMRAAMGSSSPEPEERLLTDDWDSDEDDVFATWLDVPLTNEESFPAELLQVEVQSDPETEQDVNSVLNNLEIDPLTALLLNDEWLAPTAPDEENPPSSPKVPDFDTPSEQPEPMEDILSATDDWFDEWANAPANQTADEQHTHYTFDTDPLPLPEEPEGDFIRLDPLTGLHEREPEMISASDDHLEATKPSASIPAPRPKSEYEPAPTPKPVTMQRRYSGTQIIGLFTFPLIMLGVATYVLFGQGGDTLFDMLREARSGTSINTTQDLILAVDTQLDVAGDSVSAAARLNDYADLAELLAEETPELEAALNDWIKAGSALIAARTTAAQDCENPDSQACHAAQQIIGDLAEQVERSRATVCTLTDCPTARATASN